MNKDLVAIFEYMEREKGIKRDTLIEAIESALKAAAKKSLKQEANISVEIHPKTGNVEVFCEKKIVDAVNNPSKEIGIHSARQLDPDCDIGQFIDVPVTPQNFGRIAAQTARQIIGQRIRMAEKDVIYEEYRHRIGELVSGVVKRFAKGINLVVDLGKVEALLPARNYPKTEKYKIGDKILALLFEVQEQEDGGAEVILTRSHPEFVKKLFFQEVPELEDGTVTIAQIARDAGYRTKMTVKSKDMRVDPVGACVGMRGSRVKNIIRELGPERIDIIPYSPDMVQLLQNVLSPIEIRKVALNEEEKMVAIVVDDGDFATVIGKRGLNAKLTSELIGCTLEVQRMSEYNKMLEIQRYELAEPEEAHHTPLELDEINNLLNSPLELQEINKLIVQNLMHAGFDTLKKVLRAAPDEIAKVPGISLEMAWRILEEACKKAKKRN